MSDSPPDTAPSRDYARIGLVVCCLLAAVLAGMLVPALTGEGVAESPAGSLFPGGSLEGNSSGGTASARSTSGTDPAPVPGDGLPRTGTGAESGFGALDPGDRTGVGGAVGAGANPYRSQETDVHMMVQSPEPAYWRTGSYDTYTGSGWEQSGGSRPYTGSLDPPGGSGTRIDYQVTLDRAATAVPTVWRPAEIGGLDELRVTDGRALRSTGRLESGVTYAATSYRPPRDPAVLRSTGRSYPAGIESQYTRARTSARLERLADEVTADAGNPYAEARAIEQWLETEKSYSLNASRTGEDVAETFALEMERGYCEYFATTMAVMLRSQGIPARYVVGYSTGEQVGQNTYSVRGMNAHAWVEVYFEDVGWVKFDPTPGGSRLQQERQSLRRSQPGVTYSPREPGSPGETVTPAGETPPDGDSGDDRSPEGETPSLNELGSPESGPSRQTENGYDVALNRSVVPGATVQVSVTRDGRPATGATVAFNGDPIGQTNRTGIVSGTVPYATRLRIAVEAGDAATLAPPGAVLGADRLYSPGGARPGDVTVPVETNASVAVTGDPAPGGTVTVTATVGGVPVREARVGIDGRSVATTDDEGRATVDLPAAPGNVTVRVERGPVRAETTVVLPGVEVSIRPRAPLALPVLGATVEARSGGSPVRNAPVSLDGERVTTTDGNGTATVSLPLAPATTASVTANGVTGEATVGHLLVNLSLVLATVALAVGGVVYAAARRGWSVRRLFALLGGLPALAVRHATWLLVTLARRASAVPAAVLAALRGLSTGRTGPRGLVARVRAWLDGWRQAHRRGSGGERDPDARSSTNASAYRSIRQAWGRFLDRVSAGRARTRTPGELARHAVERDGLPAGPVRELRDAFREVEYGERSPEDRVERVERAIAAIERADRETDPQATDGTGTGDGSGDAPADRRDGT